MSRLHAAELVVAFLLNAKTTSLDLLARVSVREGIAGVKPGAWMKDTIPKRELVEVFGNAVREDAAEPGWRFEGARECSAAPARFVAAATTTPTMHRSARADAGILGYVSSGDVAEQADVVRMRRCRMSRSSSISRCRSRLSAR